MPDDISIKFVRRVLFLNEEQCEYFLRKAKAGWKKAPNLELDHKILFSADPRRFPPGFNPSWEPGGEP